MKKLKVKITFTESILGSHPASQTVYSDFIASNAPNAPSREEEIATHGVEREIEKGTTVFPKLDDGRAFIYDYQLKGFFKAACDAMRRAGGTESAKMKAYKKIIDTNIFIQDRKNVIGDYELEQVTLCQRPLRAQTMQGERVSIASSEEIPAGATCEFTILMFSDSYETAVREWLDYGAFNGLGQWRNGSHGRFTWEELPLEN